jgi:hypothetical protein
MFKCAQRPGANDLHSEFLEFNEFNEVIGFLSFQYYTKKENKVPLSFLEMLQSFLKWIEENLPPKTAKLPKPK